jgi:DNA-directed RNA polymerase specialized sigma24 family protein
MSSSSHASPLPPPELARLRAQLLDSTRGRHANVPREDAEDVVQEAMIRFLREPQRDRAPSAEVRAHVALKRERANYYRRRGRRREQLGEEPVALLAGGTEPDARFTQAAVAIEQIAGADVRALVELLGDGYTYSDVAAALGWTDHKVDAARQKLRRCRNEIAAAAAIHFKEVSDGR